MLKKTQNASNKAETDALRERLINMRKEAEEIIKESNIPAAESEPITLDLDNLEE